MNSSRTAGDLNLISSTCRAVLSAAKARQLPPHSVTGRPSDAQSLPLLAASSSFLMDHLPPSPRPHPSFPVGGESRRTKESEAPSYVRYTLSLLPALPIQLNWRGRKEVGLHLDYIKLCISVYSIKSIRSCISERSVSNEGSLTVSPACPVLLIRSTHTMICLTA